MEKFNVYLSIYAENDFRDIIRYISSQLSSPLTAVKMTEIIEKAISGLSYMPQSHPLVSDERLSILGYRKVNVKNYTVFFSIDEKEKTVHVERILFSRRDWLRIL